MWSVLAQITRNNFFMKGKGQKFGVGLHRSQWTDYNFSIETQTQICRHKSQKNNFFLWNDKNKNVMCAGTNHS